METDEAPLVDRWILVGEMMRDENLNDSARRVGWAILDHVNRKSGDAWPSYERLATVTGLSRAAVGRGVKLLLDEGYFDHIRGGGNQLSEYPGERKGLSNRYRPRFDKCPLIAIRRRPTKSNGSDHPAALGSNPLTALEKHYEKIIEEAFEKEVGRSLREADSAVSEPDFMVEDVF